MNRFRIVRQDEDAIRILDDEKKRELVYVAASTEELNRLMYVFSWMDMVDYDFVEKLVNRTSENLTGIKK